MPFGAIINLIKNGETVMKEKRTAKQLILLGLVVACAVLLALGLFLPWLTSHGIHNGNAVEQGIPIFDNTYTIMSNYKNTFPISVIRFIGLLCALGCMACAFLIIFGVVEFYQPEKGVKIFFSVITMLVGIAVAVLSVIYLVKINEFFANSTTYFAVAFGFITVPLATIGSGICLLLYK